MFVLPETKVLRADPPARLDGRSLGHDQACTAHGPAAQMDEVPVTGETVFARILAHRRNEYPVPENNLTDLQRIE
jgi:hypothetical protein